MTSGMLARSGDKRHACTQVKGTEEAVSPSSRRPRGQDRWAFSENAFARAFSENAFAHTAGKYASNATSTLFSSVLGRKYTEKEDMDGSPSSTVNNHGDGGDAASTPLPLSRTALEESGRPTPPARRRLQQSNSATPSNVPAGFSDFVVRGMTTLNVHSASHQLRS